MLKSFWKIFTQSLWGLIILWPMHPRGLLYILGCQSYMMVVLALCLLSLLCCPFLRHVFPSSTDTGSGYWHLYKQVQMWHAPRCQALDVMGPRGRDSLSGFQAWHSEGWLSRSCLHTFGDVLRSFFTLPVFRIIIYGEPVLQAQIKMGHHLRRRHRMVILWSQPISSQEALEMSNPN